jgi:hypothetical protein
MLNLAINLIMVKGTDFKEPLKGTKTRNQNHVNMSSTWKTKTLEN